jgi:hypothetical protein
MLTTPEERFDLVIEESYHRLPPTFVDHVQRHIAANAPETAGKHKETHVGGIETHTRARSETNRKPATLFTISSLDSLAPHASG